MFCVVTVLLPKIQVFWHVPLRQWVIICQSFRGSWCLLFHRLAVQGGLQCLRLQGQAVQEEYWAA